MVEVVMMQQLKSSVATAISKSLAVQNNLAADLLALDEIDDRYAYIIELGRRLPPYPTELLTTESRLSSCAAPSWLGMQSYDGRLFFYGKSESPIIAGLIAMAIDIYSGMTPEEILDVPLTLFAATGLARQLSPHRLDTLYRTIERIVMTAEGFATEHQTRHWTGVLLS